MTREADPCWAHAVSTRIDAAFRVGDFEGLRAALDSPEGFPNVSGPPTIGHCLEYAIYHSPLSFIRTLLERGADPNYVDHAGLPSLIAALTCLRSAPGSPARPDAYEILELLLAAGADPNQRGLNDYTPLHWAAATVTSAGCGCSSLTVPTSAPVRASTTARRRGTSPWARDTPRSLDSLRSTKPVNIRDGRGRRCREVGSRSVQRRRC
jgi:hypothetical protein